MCVAALILFAGGGGETAYDGYQKFDARFKREYMNERRNINILCIYTSFCVQIIPIDDKYIKYAHYL